MAKEHANEADTKKNKKLADRVVQQSISLGSSKRVGFESFPTLGNGRGSFPALDPLEDE